MKTKLKANQPQNLPLKNNFVTIGRIGKTYGINGWIKIHSFTETPIDILNYPTWFLKFPTEWRPFEIAEYKIQGQYIVVKFQGFNTPEEVKHLTNKEIAIDRTLLPIPDDGCFYWNDLQGLTVINLQGVELGTVDYLFESGGTDIMVIVGAREHLIPFIMKQFVINVDLEKGIVTVDWDSNF